jgi:hypothetical protein
MLKLDFKQLKKGEGFLLRRNGAVYIKTCCCSGRQVTGTRPGREFWGLNSKVIWLGKIVDVVLELGF